MKIELLERGIDVSALNWALRRHPELWNQNTDRTRDPQSPHHGLDDIWLRYAPGGEQTNEEHSSQWYPSATMIGARPLVQSIFERYRGKILGGVLVTRIPPGAQCRPHEDHGWHARAYEKFALQIESAPGQLFCFEDELLETAPGDIFWFDNQFEHWVTNPTAYERVTMIVCMKR